MSENIKACEREGCTRQTRRGYLMCATCWAMVPKKIQRDVYRTWKAFLSYRPGTKTQLDTFREYEGACADASDAVNAAMGV